MAVLISSTYSFVVFHREGGNFSKSFVISSAPVLLFLPNKDLQTCLLYFLVRLCWCLTIAWPSLAELHLSPVLRFLNGIYQQKASCSFIKPSRFVVKIPPASQTYLFVENKQISQLAGIEIGKTVLRY